MQASLSCDRCSILSGGHPKKYVRCSLCTASTSRPLIEVPTPGCNSGTHECVTRALLLVAQGRFDSPAVQQLRMSSQQWGLLPQQGTRPCPWAPNWSHPLPSQQQRQLQQFPPDASRMLLPRGRESLQGLHGHQPSLPAGNCPT